MDSELIYAKTASGEEAMHQRTRVMQRNARMILILVDGQSTVADLCLKTGNQQLTENALRELEKSGLIEPRDEQDSLWAESKKVAQEIRAAAIDKANQFSSPEAKTIKPGSESVAPFVDSIFQTPLRSDSSLSQFSFPPMPFGRVPDERISPDKGKNKPSKKKSARAEESKPSVVDRLKALLPRTSRVSIKPIRRGPRHSMGWPVVLVFCILGVLAVAFLTVKFFPYDNYLPDVEAAFTQASGRSVKVGTMRVDVYPNPGLILGDVRIGADKDGLRISEIRLQPVISTLMESKRMFREAVLSGVTLPAELITGLPDVFIAMSKPTAKASVERVRFEKTVISFGGLGFSGLDGEAKLTQGGGLQALMLRSPDRSLSLEAKPLAEGLDVNLGALSWRMSEGSPFLFDSASLKGSLANGVFTISNMDLRIFDGLIQGVAILRADKKPTLSGEISFERVNATRFGDALGVGPQFAGETAGKIRFSATADSWTEIFSALDADGEFSIRRGSIRGIDLAEAVRRVSSAPVQGGATVFEHLSGKIRLRPANYQFSGLVLNSGLMQSTGFVEIGKDLKVNGKMELQMRGTVNQTRVPIFIYGPLKTPSTQVGKNG
jgi:hypothetical protein